MKFPQFLRKKKVYIPLALVLLLVLGWGIYASTQKSNYETTQAAERDFAQEVSITGKVIAANDVDLAFESGGRVTSIPVTVGMKVSRGTRLASVESGDLYASLLGAQARQQSAQADLDAVVRGSRPTEIDNLEDAVSFAKTDLVLGIKNAYIVADDALRSKIDVMFTNPTGFYPDFVEFGDGSRRNDIQDSRVEIGDMLEDWKKEIDILTIKNYELTDKAQALENLQNILSFVEDLVIASSSFENSSSITETQRVTYIANISSARASINTSINTLNSASQAYVAAQGKLDLAAEGSTQEDIARAQAAVRSAQASVLQAQAALGKTTIVAPFSGVITRIDLKVGQIISPGESAIFMISDANFEIESYIPEADIAKVKVGDLGTTTLDAYGDDVTFSVVVTAIDLSETQIDGVTSYKTTLQFSEVDDRIRSGMTANIELSTAIREGVLSIPQSSIINASGKRSVLLMQGDGKTESRDVTTGSIDNLGNIEIRTGLEAGETVVTNPTRK